MRRTLTVLVLLALTACRPQEAAAPSAPAAADVHVRPDAGLPSRPGVPAGEFVGEFDVRGTEPFWAVNIRRGGLTVQRPDHPTRSVANPGVTQDGDKAVWSTTAAGQPLIVTLSVDGACSDGMSDLVYRYSAVVVLGSETLRGCAFKLTDRPQGRQ